ncbi:MAG: energy transducer TonB [Rhizobium sp.]|nr:energy transducer TonB [Rhizobium sp.]
MRPMRLPLSLFLVALVAACTADPGAETASPQQTAAEAPAAPAAPAAPTDEAGLRAAAASALADQRLYSPVGDNAVEHYLALRALVPGDANIETALVELLPYALIGSEQAIARGDFTEARRLVGLVERADAELPALSRLRDSLVSAEAEAAKAALAAEQEAARRVEAEKLAATAEAEAEARQRVAAATPASTPAPARARPAPAAAARTPAPAPAVAATPAVPRPSAPAAATVVPKLVSAPQPRYPLMALRRKLEGEVLLELSIRPDGSVGNARVVSATPPGLFDDAAVAAATRWRFEQSPAPVTTRQVLRFRLPREGAQPAS